ncbi:hypothetical protein BVRB_4g090680 [Beta vulgaris subsp. vulgaris]|nr:hypothetical protein BVRB_4g090680 [Beta vulgaris subsp. vulgaris]
MKEMEKVGYVPLFETKQFNGRLLYRLFAVSIFMAIFMVWVYRVTQMPEKGEEGRWAWIGLFGAELWFSLYWFLTQVLRWNLVYRHTFKDRLSIRYEDCLPKVDIFVCTADPVIEPPIMVINTILSVMAYDYPPEKLSIYLSDDGCSILTFYALFVASHFSKHWLPYCRKYNVQPRSPAAYFRSMHKPMDANHSSDLASIKDLYEELQDRIETSTKLCRIPEEVHNQHKGFSRWKSSYTSKHDHDVILQILIDGRHLEAKDVEGCTLPSLVYLAREKRPQHFHNFKAGALNALIRVSSEISNGPIILNVDCDMYSNNPQSIRDALCFFMDEKKSQGIAFVQFPQCFENVTKNDLYGSVLRVPSEVEIEGIDALGGPFYLGTGCFHQREILCGRKYDSDYKIEWKTQNATKVQGSVEELEEKAKTLASCSYEINSQWGKEMGVKYGSPIEDVFTGLAIQCRGWKSVLFNPSEKAFLGMAPTTLVDTLVQHNRWSEGWLQLMLYHCPLYYGHQRISLGTQLGYSHFCLWACNSWPTLYYCIIPSLYMLKGICLFPQVSSTWFFFFAYIIVAKYSYSLGEFIHCGGTTLGWWNEQRMWLYKRTSSYIFAFVDTLLKLWGISKLKFVITSKIANEDVMQRYEKEIMEFGVDSPMFIILETIALINLFTLVFVTLKMMIYEREKVIIDRFVLQFLLCGVLVLINLPLYGGVFIRKDKGKIPSSVTIKATFVALLVCFWFVM